MTQPQLISEIDVESLSGLSDVDRYFAEGEYGEVRLFLDSQLATSAERDTVLDAADELEAELLDDGMRPWEGQRLVDVDWPSRRISIRFIAQASDNPQGGPHAFVMAAFLIAPVLIRGASYLARSSKVLSFLGRVPGLRRVPSYVTSVPGAAAMFKLLRRAMKLPVIGRFFVAAEIVGLGAAIWVMLDENQRIQVLKWPGRMAAKAAGAITSGLIGAVGAPMLIGVGVLGIGAALLMMPSR
jgi:hypothetical protein